MAEDHRSHLSVVIVCPPTQRSHTSIYRWLEEVGAPPATVSAVYTTLSDFLEGSPLSATTRIDLVLVARTCDDDDADIAATRRISSAGHRVILFGTTLLDDAVLHYLDAGGCRIRRGRPPTVGLHRGDHVHGVGVVRSGVKPGQRRVAGLDASGIRGPHRMVSRQHQGGCRRTAGHRTRHGEFTSAADPGEVCRGGTIGQHQGRLIARAVQDGLVDVYEL